MWTDWKINSYILSQIGNADEMPLYFDVLSYYAVDDFRAQSVMIETMGDEWMWVTIMLVVLADVNKLPPYMILNRKTVPKDRLSRGIIATC